MSEIDGVVISGWSVIDNEVWGVGTSQSTSRIQLNVNHCVLHIGCFTHTYPIGTIVAKYDNTATITTVIDG